MWEAKKMKETHLVFEHSEIEMSKCNCGKWREDVGMKYHLNRYIYERGSLAWKISKKKKLFWEWARCAILILLTFPYIWSTFPPGAFTNFYHIMRLSSSLKPSQYEGCDIANICIFYFNQVFFAREVENFYVQ